VRYQGEEKREQFMANQVVKREQFVVKQRAGAHTADQVRLARDFLMDSVVSEVAACKVFGYLPHWDDEPPECVPPEHVEFAHSVRAAQEVFSDLTHETVVWDEEFEHPISYRGGLLERSLSPSEWIPTYGHVELFSPEAARYGDHLVRDERPSVKVKWDEMPENLDFHEGFAQQLDLSSDYMSNDKVLKPLFNSDILEELGEIVCQDTTDMTYNLELHSNILEVHISSRDNEPGEIFNERVWNEHILSDLEGQDDLLQDQTMCADYLSDEKIKLTDTLDQNEVFEDILCQATLKHANISHNLELYGSYRTGKAEDLGGSNAISVKEELTTT
jgi:hypothetical protein